MKLQYAIATLLLTITSGPLFAETLSIHVNGMVCGFCAQGIDKNFRKESGVEDVKVDLGQKLVTVQTKTGQVLADEKIKEIITGAGFELKSIERK